jgi:hypothetical protein
MEQSQTLPIDYGIENGRMKYHGLTGSLWDWNVLEPRTEKFIRDQIVASQTAANLGYSLYGATTFGDGFQNFASSEEKRPNYNSCSNEKMLGVMYPFHLSADYGIPTGVIIYYPYYVFKLDYRYASFIPFVKEGANTGVSLWSAAESARGRAWRSMQPRFEGRISLLNFIFELKDFRDILKVAGKINYRSIATDLESLRKVVSRARKGMSLDDVTVGDIPRIVKNLDYFSRGLAAGYLTNEFAIKPLVRDVTIMHQMASNAAQDAQLDFQKHGEMTNRSHYTESLFKDSDVLVAPTSNFYWRELKRESRAKFTANMEYLYSYRKRPSIAAIRRYWGLDLNAEVVWNALPFSFIVDYFVGISDALNAMGTDPNVDVNLTQYCESILYEREAGWFLRKDPRICFAGYNGNITADGTNALITGYRYSKYERRVVEPSRGMVLPKVHLPSFGQSVNLVALVRCWI